MEIAAVGRQMRRLSGSCGGAARRAVLAAPDVEVIPNYDGDVAAWVRRPTAKKGGGGGDGEDPKRKDEAEATGGAVKKRAGLRNRRYRCDGGYHLAPGREMPMKERCANEGFWVAFAVFS